MAQKKSNIPALLLVLGLIWLLSSIFSCGDNDSSGYKTRTVSESSRRIEAFVMSHDYVKRYIKSPSSAEFPVAGDSHTVKTGAGNYLTKSYVDSQNSLGAMIRTNYYCELEYNEEADGWKIITLVFPDQNKILVNNYPKPEPFKRPEPDPTDIGVGETFLVSKETPLMPYLDPANPMEAISKMKRIPKSGGFEVFDKASKNGTPWFKVRAFDRRGDFIGDGWINSIALLGQQLKPTAKILTLSNPIIQPDHNKIMKSKSLPPTPTSDAPDNLLVLQKYKFNDAELKALQLYRSYNLNSELVLATQRNGKVIEILDKLTPDDNRPEEVWYNVIVYNATDSNNNKIKDLTGWLCSEHLGYKNITRWKK
ncbi:MAG: hypothetical protein U9Q39_01675 [Pseudomonadota bacterium]|nr:hypothetical protein [Pseudomonadota bacterium]